MVKVITGQLTAHGLLSTNSAAFATNEWDFAVRAPIGIVVDKLIGQIGFPNISGFGTLEQRAEFAFTLDENAAGIAETSIIPLVDTFVGNSRALMVMLHHFDGDNTTGLASAGQEMSQYQEVDFTHLPLDERPVSFNPMLQIGAVVAPVEATFQVSMYYRLAEFDSRDLALQAAGRL